MSVICLSDVYVCHIDLYARYMVLGVLTRFVIQMRILPVKRYSVLSYRLAHLRCRYCVRVRQSRTRVGQAEPPRRPRRSAIT